MNCAIYQYWDGPEKSGNNAGREAMREYANRIGAEYIYEHNPKWQQNGMKYDPYFGCLKPIYDKSFAKYDYVMFADLDVWPVENLEENIFDQFYAQPEVEIGICEEIDMPYRRAKRPHDRIGQVNDNRWAEWAEKKWGVKMPRTEEGYLKIYNTGVLVFKTEAFSKMRSKLYPIAQYQRDMNMLGLNSFYPCDQPYLHGQLPLFNWITMDYKWNSQVCYKEGTSGNNRPVHDLRNNPNFVHIQLSGADNQDGTKLKRVVNLPVAEWKL